MTLASWAEATERVSIGLMVGANTFRNPALVAKMVTTLDHLSGGRAVLGLGGAWYETEHTAFGIDFGSGVGERLDRLDEAAELVRGMLRGEEPTARGRFYHAREVRKRAATAAGEAPHPDRRRRREEDAGHRGALRRRVGDRRHRRGGPLQGRGAPPVVRGGRARRVGDRARARPGRLRDPRQRGGGEAGGSEIGARNGGWRGPQAVGP